MAPDGTMENLDYHFLKYIGVTRESQRDLHAFYLPFFQGCSHVLDLGCGEGFFVEMLEEKGIKAVGIDQDARCCRSAVERGLNVVCQDAFQYLREIGDQAVDGIFCSHLVEHLTYEQVLYLLSLCHGALAPGGTIVLTTPNARSLFSHLEMFYMHFGHVSFYHPNLLAFFLRQVGFSDPVAGENPNLVGLLLNNYHLQELNLSWEEYSAGPRGLLQRLHTSVGRLLFRPFLDRLITESNQNFRRINQMLDVLDCSFECFVKANRPK